MIVELAFVQLVASAVARRQQRARGGSVGGQLQIALDVGDCVRRELHGSHAGVGLCLPGVYALWR